MYGAEELPKTLDQLWFSSTIRNTVLMLELVLVPVGVAVGSVRVGLGEGTAVLVGDGMGVRVTFLCGFAPGFERAMVAVGPPLDTPHPTIHSTIASAPEIKTRRVAIACLPFPRDNAHHLDGSQDTVEGRRYAR